MPTSLVTGGAGFLGSHLCDYLLARGQRVICVDNLETGSLENIKHLKNGADFRFEMFDITAHYEIEEPVDFVYHMASPASPIDYARLPLHTLKVGAYGTHNTLGLAKKHRARFLLASTSEVYGDPLVHPQPETYWGNVNPIGPRGVYDEAKRYAEALTMAYLRQQGVDTAIARIFNTFGPRMRPNDGRAIPGLPAAGARRPARDGVRRRRPDAQLLLRRRPDPRPGALAESDVHEPVNIGNPNEMSLLEMAKLVIELTGSRSEVVFEALPWTTRRCASRTSPARGTCSAGSPRSSSARASEDDRALHQDPRRACVAMSSAEAKNLEAISKAIDHHNSSCEWPAVAIEMNPFEVERLGWDSISGLPIRSNPDLGTGSFRVVCAREEGCLARRRRSRRWPTRPSRPR